MRNSRIFRTSRNTGERLTEIGRPVEVPNASGHAVRLSRDGRFQQIRGFGGAFTEASCHTLARLPRRVRERVIEDYFDPRNGHGYVMGRLHINSSDFALESYNYVDNEDTSLESFDIARENRWVIPTIKEAQAAAGSELTLLASPWSPPGWMKTNGEMTGGGRLLPEFRQTWADYLLRYVNEMNANNLRIDMMTIQNEPEATQIWDSCLYSGAEEATFVRDHLGPTLHRNGRKEIKLLIWDHNRDRVFDRAQAVLNDLEAARYVWGVAHHWYVSEEFGNLSLVHAKFPDTHLIFTEGCQEGGVHLRAWHTGERYGRNISGDLRNWVEAWLDWNLILDEDGGPNHVGNYCDAPLIADTHTGEVHHNSSYWYIGHFSRHVPPGSVRIGSTGEGEPEGLHHIAFLRPSGTIVAIAMNESDHDITLDWVVDGKIYRCELPAHSIITVAEQ